jgi:hypothetical protein
VSLEQDLCSGYERIDSTMERLWLNATCWPTSLPADSTKSLKVLGFSYIPVENWHLPERIADMPKQLEQLSDQCKTSAYEVILDGYWKVKQAIDRECICSYISYKLCQGSCQVFENRIEYVSWLHSACGDLSDWYGFSEDGGN